MTPQLATLACFAVMVALFRFDSDREARTSKALWIPVLWLSIATSRAVSQWLGAFGLYDGGWIADSPDQYVEGSPLDRNVFVALLILALIVLFRRRQKVASILKANAPILLFLFYCALSVSWSDYPDVAFKRWIKELGDVVMVMVVLTDPDRTLAVKRLLARVGIVMVPLSVLFIKYYPDVGRSYDRFAYTPIYNGVTTGKNLLGMTCMVVGIAAVWRLLQTLARDQKGRRFWPLLSHCVFIAMLLWLFWIANSMTSLSCFLMASGLMVATSFRTIARKGWLVHVMVLAILSISFSALFLNTGGDLLETMGRNSTLTGRTEIWSLVLGMTGNTLTGTGFESFWLGARLQHIWDLYWWHPNEAHDGYLEIYLNLGWIGVSLLGFVIVTGYRNVTRCLRHEPAAGKLALAFFVAAVAYNFTESAIKTLCPVWFGFLLAVMAIPDASGVDVSAEADDSDHIADPDLQSEHLLGVGLREQSA